MIVASCSGSGPLSSARCTFVLTYKSMTRKLKSVLESAKMVEFARMVNVNAGRAIQAATVSTKMWTPLAFFTTL